MSTTKDAASTGQPGVISAPLTANSGLGSPSSVANSGMPAQVERRHRVVYRSFFVGVALPLLVLAVSLWVGTKDQYASYLGFSVRSEGTRQPLELLGGLVGMASSSTSDPDILYKFLNGRELLQKIDARLDLQQVWGGEKGGDDPFFSYSGDHTIELLLKHWHRKVDVYFDSGMIDVQVLAFDPKDAQAITNMIFEESSTMINDLNAIARDDSLKYSREELDKSVERMKVAREAIAAFREKHQLVDPSANVQGQLGVLESLQQALAENLINRGMLNKSDDPRMQELNLRIKVIEDQIELERQKFGGKSADGEFLSSVVGDYERLQVDRQFAEAAYTAALAAFDVAQSEVQRKSRYLAAYVKPTLAQAAEYPKRMKIFMVGSFFFTLLWAAGVLVFYSIRSRR